MNRANCRPTAPALIFRTARFGTSNYMQLAIDHAGFSLSTMTSSRVIAALPWTSEA